MDEDRLAFLDGAVYHPFLGEHQLFRGQFQTQVHTVYDDTVYGLDQLFEVVQGLYCVYLGQDLDMGTLRPKDVFYMLNVAFSDCIRECHEVKA